MGSGVGRRERSDRRPTPEAGQNQGVGGREALAGPAREALNGAHGATQETRDLRLQGGHGRWRVVRWAYAAFLERPLRLLSMETIGCSLAPLSGALAAYAVRPDHESDS